MKHIRPYAVPTAGRWAVRFSDPRTGKIRNFSCADTEKNAAAIADHIAAILDARAAGRAFDTKWLNTTTPAMHEKLVEFGIVGGDTLAAKSPIAAHIELFAKSLEAKNKRRRATEVRTSLMSFTTTANIHTLADISFAAAEAAANRMLAGDDSVRPMAPLTVRKHLGILQQLCKWATKRGLLQVHPLAVLPEVEGGVQREKKALTIDEQRFLIAATATLPDQVWHHRDGRIRSRISGTERALVYRLVFGTGLRANEVRQLTADSFKLDMEDDTGAPAPHVYIPRRTRQSKAGTGTKNAQQALLPLTEDTAAIIQQHIRKKHPQAAAFALPMPDETAEMVRRDMKAARQIWLEQATSPADRNRRERSTFLAEYNEVGGRAGFHALRTSYATTVCRLEGLSDMEVAERVRHHDPKTTKEFYLKADTSAGRRFAAKMPSLEGPSLVLPTGTEG